MHNVNPLQGEQRAGWTGASMIINWNVSAQMTLYATTGLGLLILLPKRAYTAALRIY